MHASAHVAPAADPFETAFARLTSYPPLRWQRRLFDDWLSKGKIPHACDIPTGLGKTATMAVWLIARAGGAALPRRLVYVVDRRAVVDQATRFAEELRTRAVDALGIADLPISTLRGKFTDNRRWLQTPSSPAIIVGTIDMIGSRLLFSGYGVSRRMRPYHAGFLGADALFVLDEAHLCPPFESLLCAIARDRQRVFGHIAECDQVIVPPLHIMSLSATGRGSRSHDPGKIFRLQQDDQGDSFIQQRMSAQKRLLLCAEVDDRNKLAEALTERAWALGAGGASVRVLIYCDRRADAVAVKKQIDGLLKTIHSGVAELMVGGRRVYEREKLDAWLVQQGFIGDSDAPQEGPAFLVATSAGEVGVDLDADHMVCDLVAWERMVQRLGRVNRRGENHCGAQIDVISVAPSRLPANAPDRAKQADEGARTTLSAIKAPFAKLPLTEDDRRDASVAAIRELASAYPALLTNAMSVSPPHPAVSRGLVDAWSLTSLRDHPGRPDVQPWLRGWEDDAPQTTIAWRRLLPWPEGKKEPDKDAVNQFFSVARVHLREVLEAPTHEVFDLITKRALSVRKAASGAHTSVQANLAGDAPVAIVLDREGQFHRGWRLDDLLRMAELRGAHKSDEQVQLHGATIVVASGLGGLTGDGMLDAGVSQVPSMLDGGWDDEVLEQIGYRIVTTGEPEPDDALWKLDTTIPLSHPEANESGQARVMRVFVARGGISASEGNLAIGRQLQALERHHAQAERIAWLCAESLGLPPTYTAMLAAVAGGHDLGKDRTLWQDAMNAPAEGRPYAKTRRGGDWRRLSGYRHEFGSLHDFGTPGRLAAIHEDLRALALHLIAAHHGRARPEIPSVDPNSHPREGEQRARETALRFARLQRRWGAWGLAWWEGLLRAVDGAASARSEKDA